MPGVKEAPTSAIFWHVDLGSYANAALWSADRRSVIAGTIEGDVAIVDSGNGAIRSRWKAHDFGMSSVALSPDEQRIATCGQDGKLCIWDTRDGSLVAVTPLPARWGTRASYSPFGGIIGVAAGKRALLVSSDGQILRELDEHASTISDLAWGPRADERDREVLATSGYGGVTLWRTGVRKAKHFSWKGSSLALAWSPDGRYLATGDQDNTVHFWIVAKGEDLEMTGYAIKVKELAWSADSRFLATGGGDGITIWDCSGKGPAGTRPISLEGHEEKITALTFAHAGDTLASGDERGRVMRWSVSEESPRATIELESAISVLAWSHDDHLLVAGTSEGILYCAGL